ncbi:MAG: hypothetical protein ACI8PZ_001283 [Myxococcota bacterium]|jgi:uncharacterized protein YndB with AHSA1/START domain
MPRELEKLVTLPGTVEEVFAAWTTHEGCRGFFAPECHVEPRVGGAYELYFDPGQPAGKRGSEGCTLLEYAPPSRLAFSWNQPPSLASIRDEKTRVEVTIRPDPEGVRVRLLATGWGDSDEWTQAWDYFERAWSIVLGRLRHRFVEGPVDWSSPE